MQSSALPGTRTAVSRVRAIAKGGATTVGRKSEWWIVGSLLTELSIICFSLLRSNVLTATYCRAATVSASPLYAKTRHLKSVALVRIKGLEPPRLSASDPKSDVATNYTISAGSITLGNHRACSTFYHQAVQRYKTFAIYETTIAFFYPFFCTTSQAQSSTPYHVACRLSR